MAGACPVPSPDDPLVQGLLASTDCHVQALVRTGYGALFAPGGVYGGVLTALLVIYVALIGYQLLLGRAQLAIGEMAMTAVKLGVVLALATQWGTYQAVVYRAVFDGPQQIGDVVLHDLAARGVLSGEDVFDGLQRAYEDLTIFTPAAPPGSQQASLSPTTAPPAPTAAPTTATPTTAPLAAASAANGQNGGGFLGKAGFDSILLLISAGVLLMSTLGVLLAAKLVLGLLLAIGPVFIAMLLFDATRGLFMGWLRASLSFAFAPLSTSLLLGLGLNLLQPSLDALEAMRDSNTYTPGVAWNALVLVMVMAGVSLGLLVAAGMVAGGLRLSGRRRAGGGAPIQAPAAGFEPAPPAVLGRSARTAAAAQAQARRDARLFSGAAATPASSAAERRVSLSVLAGGRSSGEPVAVEQRLGQAPRRSAQPRTLTNRAPPSGGAGPSAPGAGVRTS
jgi:type IV secretion system protein VirB6